MERQLVQKTKKPATRVNHVQQQSDGPALSLHPLAGVQSSIGNHAVQRLISSSYIQTKLQISTPGDPFEQEADRVADTVMRMPEPQPERIEENFQIFDFELEPEDIAAISALDRGEEGRTGPNPDVFAFVPR